MDFLNIFFIIPEHIKAGLVSGAYERVGGVVRDAVTKQVVCWLREAQGPMVNAIQALHILGPAASVLNLAISTATLAVVIERTAMLEKRLLQVQDTLQKIGVKVEIMYYAKLKSALEMAAQALRMEDPANRRSAAMTAINQLIEAWNYTLPMADNHLKTTSEVADEYLLTLFLIVLAEAHCYLELGELASARQRIEDSKVKLRPYVERYVTNLLTGNPTIYLQPALKDHVSLHRLTRIYQWLDPSLDESQVFDRLRDTLFRQHMLANNKWIEQLPPAIWHKGINTLPREDVFGILSDCIPLPLVGVLVPQIPDIGAWIGGLFPSNNQDIALVYGQLVLAMAEIETMIESYNRFEAYADEIAFIQSSQLTFAEWSQLTTTHALPAPESADFVCIVPRPTAVETTDEHR